MRRAVQLFLVICLMAGARASEAESAVDYDVAVVGGGPAGLAAAIEAKKAGAARVLVVEERERVRGRAWLLQLRRGTLDNLAHLEVPLGEYDGLTYVERRVTVDEGAGTEHTQRLSPPHADARRASHRIGDMLAPRDGSVAVVPTGTLEEGLIRSAERNGVELRFLTRATGLAHEREAGSVTLSSGASVRAGLVILADGPSDALHASLGVQRMVFPGGSMPVLGAVSKAAEPAAPPSRAEIIVHKQARADAPGSVMVMRIATADAASVLVEVPAGLTLRSAAERQAWFESHGRLVGKTADLSSPREFQLASSHADRVQLGEHVVLIGDAARTGYGPSGLGVNWALRDAARVGALVRRLGHAVDASDRQQAMRWFARETTVASLRLHQLLWSRSAHEEAGSTRAHAGTRPSLAELRRLAVPVRR